MKYAIAALALFLLFGCAAQPIPQGVDSEGHPYRGASSPKVVILEYSDFECPFCARAQPTVEEILRAYPNEVQLQFRHFPLDAHPRAFPSAVAAVCAQRQGKFWEMHDKMFGNQNALSDADLKKYAEEVGLDAGLFGDCMASEDAKEAVRNEASGGLAIGVQATPTFMVGDAIVRGAQPFSKFKAVIDAEIAKAS